MNEYFLEFYELIDYKIFRREGRSNQFIRKTTTKNASTTAFFTYKRQLMYMTIWIYDNVRVKTKTLYSPFTKMFTWFHETNLTSPERMFFRWYAYM